jgi:hypothetical protein
LLFICSNDIIIASWSNPANQFFNHLEIQKMNIPKIDRELHAQAMAKGQFIIAGLIADKLITTGAKLAADQQANPTWHAAKRAEVKRIKDAHLFRIELHDWKDRLMLKFHDIELTEEGAIFSTTGEPAIKNKYGEWEVDTKELKRWAFEAQD